MEGLGWENKSYYREDDCGVVNKGGKKGKQRADGHCQREGWYIRKGLGWQRGVRQIKRKGRGHRKKRARRRLRAGSRKGKGKLTFRELMGFMLASKAQRGLVEV